MEKQRLLKVATSSGQLEEVDQLLEWLQNTKSNFTNHQNLLLDCMALYH